MTVRARAAVGVLGNIGWSDYTGKQRLAEVVGRMGGDKAALSAALALVCYDVVAVRGLRRSSPVQHLPLHSNAPTDDPVGARGWSTVLRQIRTKAAL